MDMPQIGHRVLLRAAQIRNQRAHRAQAERPVLGVVLVRGQGGDLLFRLVVVELGLVHLRNQCAEAVLQIRQHLLVQRAVGDDLAGRVRGQRREQRALDVLGRQVGRVQRAGGDVRIRGAVAAVLIIERADIIVLVRGQKGPLGHGAGRDDAHHVALDDPLRLRRVLQLLADGHAVALGDELGDVALHRMVRYAAHRRALAAAAVLAGQHQLERLRGGHSVVVKHFVKVAQSKKQDAVRIFALDCEILLHHRRNGHIDLSPCIFTEYRAFSGSRRSVRSRRRSYAPPPESQSSAKSG